MKSFQSDKKSRVNSDSLQYILNYISNETRQR